MSHQATATSCTDYQFLTNNGLCIDCNNVFYGCISCSYQSSMYSMSTISSLQCTVCDYGLYLLKFSNSTSESDTTNIVSMCIPSCEDFGDNYVANPATRQCEYCGPFCTRCTLKYGCTDSFMDDRGYQLSTSNYVSSFPFSTTGQPTATFAINQKCTNSKCDECENYSATGIIGNPSFSSSTLVGYCDSCYGYINNLVDSSSSCQLCVNSSYSNCNQCDSTDTTQCLSCSNGYFLNNTYVTVNVTTVVVITNTTVQTVTTNTKKFAYTVKDDITVIPQEIIPLYSYYNVTIKNTTELLFTNQTTSAKLCGIAGSCTITILVDGLTYDGALSELLNHAISLIYIETSTAYSYTISTYTTVITTTTTTLGNGVIKLTSLTAFTSSSTNTQTSATTTFTNVTMNADNTNYQFTPKTINQTFYDPVTYDSTFLSKLDLTDNITISYPVQSTTTSRSTTSSDITKNIYDLTFSKISVQNANTTTLYDQSSTTQAVSSTTTSVATTLADNLTISYTLTPVITTTHLQSCDICDTTIVGSGCLRCSSTQCLECQNGYTFLSSTNTCFKCSLQSSVNPYLYLFKPYRSSLCTTTSAITPRVCDYGYLGSTFPYQILSSTSTQCQLKCGAGQYPVVSFTTLNLNEHVLDSTTCVSCPSSCQKCVGSDATQDCTLCNSGYYLQFTDLTRRKGICIIKQTATTTSYDLFITNVENTAIDSQRVGSLSYPFLDLDDAITKTKEIAAQYSSTITVNIYFFSGTHYAVRNRGVSLIYQSQTYYDPYALNYQLNIANLPCSYTTTVDISSYCSSSQVTIINKKRELFIIDVPISLQLTNIIINSIDSILPPTNSCLNSRRQCCTVSGTTVSNVLSTDTSFSCATAFTDLNLNENCQTNMPRTMFRMKVNNLGQITSPNILTLSSVSITNIFYDMNSLINMTSYGAQITLSSSSFTQISMCGAIVKNNYATLPAPTLSYLSSDVLTDFQKNFIKELTSYQIAFYYKWFGEQNFIGTTSPFSCSSTCFKLTITSCTFTSIPFKKSLQTSLALVSNSNGLRYQGSILNLYSFGGEVRISGSTFTNNQFQYDGCIKILSSYTISPTSTSTFNNQYQLYNANSDFNLYQIKALINIQQHSYGIFLYTNSFSNNIGFKGIINIEIMSQNTYPLMINQNQFSQNSGIIDSNVLNIRKLNTVNLLGTSYTSVSTFRCGGIQISTNTFSKNIGCTQTNGAIYLYCSDLTSGLVTNYVSSIDSSYFIGSSISTTLATADIKTLQNSTLTYLDSAISINLHQLYLSSNVFSGNYAGFQKSIVQIQGFPLVYMIGDSYTNNQNYHDTGYRTQSSLFSQQSDQSSPVALTTITQAILNQYSYKAQSILTIVRALYLQIESVTFSNNYIIDTQTFYLSSNRSNGLLLIDFGGYLSVTKMVFTNNIGIQGSSDLSNIVGTTVKSGFYTYLFAFSNSFFSVVSISTLSYIKNTAYYDGTFEGSPIPYFLAFDKSMFPSDITIQISTLTMNNNVIFNGKGMIFLDVPQFTITSGSFQNNGQMLASNTGGIFYIYLKPTLYSEFSLCEFKNNYGDKGAQITIKNSNITYLTTSYSYQSYILNFTNCTFSQLYSQSEAAAVFIEYNPWFYVGFISCTFGYNYGQITNDVYFDKIYGISFDKITWTTNSNNYNQAQFLYKNIYDTYVSVSNSNFNCYITQSTTTIKSFSITLTKYIASLIKILVPSTNSATGGQYADTGSNQFYSNIYSNCNNGYQGAVFNLQNGSFLYDQKSQYTTNSALYGGVAYLNGNGTSLLIKSTGEVGFSTNIAYYGGVFYGANGVNITVQAATFSSNNGYEGAIAYIELRSYISISNQITIESSTIWKRGLICILSNSYIYLTNAVIQQNTAIYDSVILYISNSREPFEKDYISSSKIYSNLQINVMYFCTILKNEVTLGGRAITVIDGALDVRDCNFNQNSISIDTEGIYAQSATIWIVNTIFLEQHNSQYYTKLANNLIGDINGDFVSIDRNSSVYIISSTFTGGRGSYGGCINVQGSSYIYIASSIFSMCSGFGGGAIYAVNYNSLTINNCSFSNNIVFNGYGQNIMSKDSKLNLTIINSTFSSYHNSIYFSEGKLLFINSITINSENLQVSSIPYREYSGGLHIINSRSIQILGNNYMNNLYGRRGGAIFIHLDLNLKNLYTIVYTILNLNINNCQSTTDGGGIYLDNMASITIQNSAITNCSAPSGFGGAINFKCTHSQTDLCKLTLNSTKLTNNKANVGGGMYWDYVEPIIDNLQSIQNNTSISYGNDIASFARELILLNESDTYLSYFNQTNKTKIIPSTPLKSYVFDNVQSGSFIQTIYLGLIDKYGQIVATNSGKALKVELNMTYENLNKDLQFTTQIFGVSTIFSSYGVYNISGLYFVASPGSTHQLVIQSVDAVDLSQPTNQLYLASLFQKTNITVYQIPVPLRSRNCIEGEAMSSIGSCSKCPQGTYLLLPPTVPQDCKVCPTEKALCLGGSFIGPKQGYWRKSNITDDFISCFVNASCLGFKAPLWNPVGECATGYYGALCSACMPEYSRSGDYKCSKCPAPIKNILRIIGIMVGVVCIVVFMVRSTLQGATKKNLSSVYIKIFTNHLQMVTITSSFKFNWPPQVTKFFSSGSSVSSSGTAIFSFDCWMDSRNPDSLNRYDFYAGVSEMRIVFEKMFMVAFLPILMVIIAVTVWTIILKRKKQMRHLETKVIATIVVLLFLVHPTITQTMVDMFNCQTFDGDVRLMVDLQVICYSGYHKLFSLAIALPCLIVYGLGIPAMVLILMRKESERLDTVAAKEKFGFLYNGYKRNNYFWEIIIMYRKILCIFVSVFLNRIGIIVQALVLLIILVLFLQLNNMRRPFIARALNDVEDLSLMTSVITIYCALFFLTSKDKTSSDFNPNSDFYLDPTGQLVLFFIIVVANIFFFVVWTLKYIFVMRFMIKEKMVAIYICLFLCCRKDKLARENEKLAVEQKRETIIEKIEEIQFFLKNMKKMYTKQIFFNDHQRFMKMLYFIEFEKSQLDMTEKQHNFYVQGKMARDRKFDPERMKAILNERIIPIDVEFGGERVQQNKQKKQSKSRILKQKYGLKTIKDSLEISISSAEIQSVGSNPKYFQKNSSLNLLEETKDISQIGLLGVFENSARMEDSKRLFLPNIQHKSENNKLFKLTRIGGEKYDLDDSNTQIIDDDNNEEKDEDISSERRIKQRKNMEMEKRLERSRNYIQKLRKKQKGKQFVSSSSSGNEENISEKNDKEDVKNNTEFKHKDFLQRIKEQKNKQKLNQEDYEENKKLMHHQDSFFKDRLFNYIEDEKEYEGVNETLDNMKAMRGLTKRLNNNENNKKNQKKNIKKTQQQTNIELQGNKSSMLGINKQKTGSQDSNKMNSQNSNASQIKIDVSSAQQDPLSPSVTLKKRNLYSIEEALQLLSMNKDMMRKPIKLEERLRPPTQKRREILIDNFCEVQEIEGKPMSKKKIKKGNKSSKEKNQQKEEEDDEDYFEGDEFDNKDNIFDDQIKISLTELEQGKDLHYKREENNINKKKLKRERLIQIKIEKLKAMGQDFESLDINDANSNEQDLNNTSSKKHPQSPTSSFGTDSSFDNGDQVDDEQNALNVRSKSQFADINDNNNKLKDYQYFVNNQEKIKNNIIIFNEEDKQDKEDDNSNQSNGEDEQINNNDQLQLHEDNDNQDHRLFFNRKNEIQQRIPKDEEVKHQQTYKQQPEISLNSNQVIESKVNFETEISKKAL